MKRPRPGAPSHDEEHAPSVARAMLAASRIRLSYFVIARDIRTFDASFLHASINLIHLRSEYLLAHDSRPA